jgi:hypothetical protein
MRNYYKYLRDHYGMSRVEAIYEVVKAWFVGDIENRK